MRLDPRALHIPWGCLQDYTLEDIVKPSMVVVVQRKTFGQVLHNAYNIPIS